MIVLGSRQRLRLFSEDGRRDQCDDEADREWLDKRHRGVEQRILVHDFEFVDFLGFLLNGGGRGAGGLHPLEDVGAVFVHEVGHKLVVDDLPGYDITKARDDRDGESYQEGFTEGDVAVRHIVAVGADTEVAQQQGQDDSRVADNIAVADSVLEGNGEGHQQRDECAGDEAEGENGLFQRVSPDQQIAIADALYSGGRGGLSSYF